MILKYVCNEIICFIFFQTSFYKKNVFSSCLFDLSCLYVHILCTCMYIYNSEDFLTYLILCTYLIAYFLNCILCISWVQDITYDTFYDIFLTFCSFYKEYKCMTFICIVKSICIFWKVGYYFSSRMLSY